MSDTYTKFRNEVMSGGTDNVTGDGTAGGPRAVVGIAVIVGLLALLGLMNKWYLVMALGLLVSIFLHEVGHFVTARWTGMKATQFFLFMGPKLWSFRRGETEYGVRAYPVGAFVRIVGMSNADEVAPEDEPRAYRNKSYPRRMLVITAGSLMHMLIAVTLLFGVFAINGTRVTTDRVGVGSVVRGSAAAIAGIEPGDFIVSIDGVAVRAPDQFTDEIRQHKIGDQVRLVVSRDGKLVPLAATLGENSDPCGVKGKAFLGVSSGYETVWSQESVSTAAGHAASDLWPAMTTTVGGLFKVMNPVNLVRHLAGTSCDESTRPTTIVGVTRFSRQIGSESGLGGIVLMLAGVNVFIGLFNMMPLLPFDGGHAALATYERLRSRRGRRYRADINKMVPVALATLFLLILLMITGLYLDITKPL